MSDGDLNRLEQEVEAARSRLTADLDRLRAPETFASFKQTVVDEVRSSKDEWIEEGKAIASDRVRHVIDDLKSRAAANPVAAAAIGAGLLWHLSRRPPITSLLIGAGVFGLLRTDPRTPSSIEPWIARAQEARQTAAQKISELSAAAREAATQVSTAGAAAKEKVQDLTARSAEVADAKLTQLKSRAGDLANETRRGVRSWNEDGDHRDAVLLGAAAAALAAALGVAYQRRSDAGTTNVIAH